jgi:hypothetical protein
MRFLKCSCGRDAPLYVVRESVVICHSCACEVREWGLAMGFNSAHPFFIHFYGIDRPPVKVTGIKK